MSEPRFFTVTELAEHVGGRISGDGNVEIQGIASLETAGPDEITYVEDEKLFAIANAGQAGCVIVPENTSLSLPCVILVKQPKLAFALIGKLLHPPLSRAPEVHATAVVAESADLALTVYVGPHASIGAGAK